MDSVLSWSARLVDGVLLPFDLLPEWLALTLFSVVSGIAILWLFGKLTNQEALLSARDRMAAAVYEIRLFADSPKRIVSSQLRLAYGTIAYTLHAMPPLIVMTAPLALLFVHLDLRYGFAHLDAQRPVLLRMVLAPDVKPEAVHVSEEGGTKVTAPPVFVPPTRELYFRVTAPKETSTVTIKVGDESVTKELTTTAGARFVNAERGSGLASLLAIGREGPLPSSGAIEHLGVHHPTRSIKILVSAPWWVHWLVISSVSALLLRKRLGVVI